MKEENKRIWHGVNGVKIELPEGYHFADFVSINGILRDDEPKSFCGKKECKIEPHFHCSLCESTNGRHASQCKYLIAIKEEL